MESQTLTLLKTRRTVRAWQKKPISPEDLAQIKQATRQAPTAGNQVLWTVISVEDPEKRSALADICDHQPMIKEAPLCWVFLADAQKWYDWYKAEGCEEKSGKPLHKPGYGTMLLSVADAVIAAQSSVIAAEALGIGSCYIGDVVENGEKLADLLDLPPFTFPAAMVIYGYKKPVSTPIPPRPRPTYNSMFMTDRWHSQSKEEMEDAYDDQTIEARNQKRLPYGNTGTLADDYFTRKYTSDFQKEMDRSAAFWLERWSRG